VLNHTVSGQQWQNLWFNGTLVGETGINAALCGTWDVPVLLVTGDRATCDEATALLGDGLTTVSVKEGLGQYGARQIPARRARQPVRRGGRNAAPRRPARCAGVRPRQPAHRRGRVQDERRGRQASPRERRRGRRRATHPLDRGDVVGGVAAVLLLRLKPRPFT